MIGRFFKTIFSLVLLNLAVYLVVELVVKLGGQFVLPIAFSDFANEIRIWVSVILFYAGLSFRVFLEQSKFAPQYTGHKFRRETFYMALTEVFAFAVFQSLSYALDIPPMYSAIRPFLFAGGGAACLLGTLCFAVVSSILFAVSCYVFRNKTRAVIIDGEVEDKQ